MTLQMTNEDAIALRAYATALQDLLYSVTMERDDKAQPESLTISVDAGIICTHAFRLGSDTPIHYFSEFESIAQLQELMTEEISERVTAYVMNNYSRG